MSALGYLLLAPDLAEFRDAAIPRLLAGARDANTAERATVALMLGSWGVAPRAFLVDPDLQVRAAAALAPSLDADPAALAEIRLALADPGRADEWFSAGAVPYLGGKFRFALLKALLRRTRDFDEVLSEALAVARMTNAYAVDSDWGPLLERAFPKSHNAGEPVTRAQREFLSAIVNNDDCWVRIANPWRWFDRAGLPHDREGLRALVTG